MVTVHGKQNSFIAGVITREAIERSDKQQIYHGLLEGRNVRIGSHGGVSRRAGTVYIDKVAETMQPIQLGYSINVPNGGNVEYLTDDDQNTYFKTTTPIGASDEYICFQVAFNKPTFLDYCDVHGCSIDNGDEHAVGGDENFFIQYSLDGSTWVDSKQIYLSYINDDYYRAHIGKSVEYIRVIRRGGKELPDVVFWSNGIKFYKNSGEQSGFRLTSLVYGATANYLLVLSSNRIGIYRNAERVGECPLPFVDGEYIQQLKFCAYGESLIVTHKEIAPFIIQRHLKDSDWRIFPIVFNNIPYYDAGIEREHLNCRASVVNNNEAYHIKSDSEVFLPSDVGCIISGNGGCGRVIQFITAAEVRVSEINKFAYYGEEPKHDGWSIDRNSKPLWGEEYGYPECCGIFANRLFLGGFKRAPDVIACSVAGDYLNFSTGDLQSDDAMVVRLATGRYNHNIRFIYGCDNLEVFTDIGIFALKKFDSGSITDLASSFYLRKSIGIEPYVSPFRTEDSGTIFLKNGRSDIRELAYSNETYSYSARSLSLWYSELIKDTISIGVSRRTIDNVTNYVYCVRRDGGVGCLNFLLADNIHVGTEWETAGKFLCSEATLQYTYFGVQRNGQSYIERLDDHAFLDSEKIYTECEGGVVDGLDHLAGCIVQVRADNEFLGKFVVSDRGEVVIPRGNWSVVHIGLPFTSLVIPILPENVQDPLLGRWMRYSGAVISVYDTQEVLVNGYVPEYIGRGYDGHTYGAIKKKDGRYRVFFGGSGELEPWLVITQDKPMMFNIRSIGYEVEVN